MPGEHTDTMNEPLREPTLRQIAQASGVAVSTVSRILSDQRAGFSVKPETRARVLHTAQRLNYRRNPIVGSLRAKRTGLIALLGLHDFATAIRGPTEVAINSMRDVLVQAGYGVCTNVIEADHDVFEPPRWRVDGAVVVDCSEPEQLAHIERQRIPYVSMNGPSGPNGSSVEPDDAEGARLAARHLASLGHRRIAFVIPDKGRCAHISVQRRHSAYIDEMKWLGADALTPAVPAQRSAEIVIREDVISNGATALIVYHHIMAVKLLRAATTYSLNVPRDLSIVCFNDEFPCANLVPSLTTIRLPGAEIGERAARALLSRLEPCDDDPGMTDDTLVPETIVIRESTAPPPAERRTTT